MRTAVALLLFVCVACGDTRDASAPTPSVTSAAAQPSAPPAPLPPPPPPPPSCVEPALTVAEGTGLLGRKGRDEPSAETLAIIATRCLADGVALARVLNDHGLAWHGKHEYEVSERIFAAAVAIAPSLGSSKFNHACALAKLERYDEAIAQLRDLVGVPDRERWATSARKDRDLAPIFAKPEGVAALATISAVPCAAPNSVSFVVEGAIPVHDSTLSWQPARPDRALVTSILAEMREPGFEVRGVDYEPSGSPYEVFRQPEFPVQAFTGPHIWKPAPDRAFLVIPVSTSTRNGESSTVLAFVEAERNGRLSVFTVDGDAGFCSDYHNSLYAVTRDRMSVGVGGDCGGEGGLLYLRAVEGGICMDPI